MTDAKQPTGGLPLDDAIYGLRNLAVGDEEEVRIKDYLDSISDASLRDEVSALVAAGNFGEAYEVAIRPTVEDLDEKSMRIAVVRFARDFVVEDDVDEDNPKDYREQQVVDLVESILAEWERLKTAWWKPSVARERPENWEVMDEVLDITGCLKFLLKAQDAGHSSPKARFLAPDLKDLRLSLAGPRSTYPGGLEVRHGTIHVGTILPNGFVIGALAKDRRLLDTLIAVAEQPDVAAKLYFDLTNSCSFCNFSLLTDAVRRHGYHESDAAAYDLPWIAEESHPTS